MYNTKGNRFYATATNEKGVSFTIQNLSDEWVLANKEAKQYCKDKNLTFEGVWRFDKKEDRNGVLTKAFKQRKLEKGKKGYKEPKFLFG